MIVFEHAWHTTRGAREYQEDSAIVGSAAANGSGEAAAGLVAVLADGMGGHTGGAMASRVCCEQFLNVFNTLTDPVPKRLREALDAANGAVAQAVIANPLLSGMGSTLIGVSFSDAGVEWISVGDSPLWLFRRGEIALLNEDHSLAPELDRLAEIGRMTVQEARSDPRRHMLRSAVTGEDLDLVDQSQKPLILADGDYVILASDGLHALEEGELARIITAYANDGPDAVARALIRAVEAVRDPHQDNATVVVVRAVPRAYSQQDHL